MGRDIRSIRRDFTRNTHHKRNTFLRGLAIIIHTETGRKINGQRIVEKGSSLSAQLAGMVAIVWAIIVSGAVIASAGGYPIIDLGTLPSGWDSAASSINNSGQAVGYSSITGIARRAALFSNGTVTDLGTLPGGTESVAYSINNSGQAVGSSSTTGTPANHAALFSNGTVTDLGTLPGSAFSEAYSINNSGQAVGYSDSASHAYHAALFSNGTVTDLGTLPGYTDSWANSINDSGQAVGGAEAEGTPHAVLFSNGTVTDLGTLPGSASSWAYSINNSGQAAGYSSTASTQTHHAALFSNGTVTDLGTLPGWPESEAYSINNSGRAVGYSYDAGNFGYATLFSNGTVTELNSLVNPSLGWTLSYARSINDAGQIVGAGYINGQLHAFLLMNFTLDVYFATVAPAGGLKSVNLTAFDTVYAWTAVSNVSWITITSGSSGTGNGTVQYSVAPNAGGVRTGTITIAGQTFTAMQGTTLTHAQIGVFRAGAWYVDRDENFGWNGCGLDGCYAYGMAGDQVVAGDWDGTGIVRLGVFRNGNWYLDYYGDGQWSGCGTTPSTDRCYSYGMTGDIPVVGDWNGNGVSKIGVFRNGTWYLDYSGTYAVTGTWAGCGAPVDPTKDACIPFGMTGDIPVVGDWNGNGVSKIGVFRNGTWYLDYSGTYAATGTWAGCGAPVDPTKDACIPFGMAGDMPVVGDWNGNGTAKIGVFRSGMWYLDYPGTGSWVGCGAPANGVKDVCASFGISGDTPVVLR